MAIEQKNYDLRELLKPYANKWVALSRDRKKIVAQGKELKEVIKKAGTRDVTLLKVFPENSFYMPQS